MRFGGSGRWWRGIGSYPVKAHRRSEAYALGYNVTKEGEEEGDEEDEGQEAGAEEEDDRARNHCNASTQTQNNLA